MFSVRILGELRDQQQLAQLEEEGGMGGVRKWRSSPNHFSRLFKGENLCNFGCSQNVDSRVRNNLLFFLSGHFLGGPDPKCTQN